MEKQKERSGERWGKDGVCVTQAKNGRGRVGERGLSAQREEWEGGV